MQTSGVLPTDFKVLRLEGEVPLHAYGGRRSTSNGGLLSARPEGSAGSPADELRVDFPERENMVFDKRRLLSSVFISSTLAIAPANSLNANPDVPPTGRGPRGWSCAVEAGRRSGTVNRASGYAGQSEAE